MRGRTIRELLRDEIKVVFSFAVEDGLIRQIDPPGGDLEPLDFG